MCIRDRHGTLESVSGMTYAEVHKFLYNSDYGNQISQFQKTISKTYNCTSPSYCMPQELSFKQWAACSITQNLPPLPYFSQTDAVLSIADWNLNQFGGSKYPEPTAVIKRRYGIDISFSEKQAKGFFNYKVGGLLNVYQLQYFVELAYEVNYSQNVELIKKLNDIFGVDSKQALALYQYVTNIIIEYFYGGMTVTKTPEEFLMGYEDKSKLLLSTMPMLAGGLNDTTLQYYILKNNTERVSIQNSSSYTYNQLNTGIVNLNQIRQIITYQGQLVINVLYLINNGIKIIGNYSSPWKTNITLDGTDGFSFPSMFNTNSNKSPVLLKNIPFDTLKYFDDGKYRNILLEHSGKSDVLDYDCYKYIYSAKNTELNDTFYTDMEGSFNLTTITSNPVIITAPYFANMDLKKEISQNITFNLTEAQIFQTPSTESYFLVEPFTGLTLERQISNQYVAYVNHNFFDKTYISSPTLFPLYIEYDKITLPQKWVDNFLSPVFSNVHKNKAVFGTMIALLILDGIFFAVVIFFAIKQRNLVKEESYENLG
eukprot:TRINITY_DN4434_c0_g1_i6.p1 TRINITY_DN4434_c0_g1~~TRINITY_DN4434_c0_g1_i6.p1  ORF type:complete len:592 (-),score=80.16 TRINITY_DN4434_c0_g1_i6:209-1828(-)